MRDTSPFMTKSLVAGAVFLAVLFGIAGCAKQTDVPITSKSSEARSLFIKAREVGENLLLDRSMELLTQAIELDPDFALAYLYRARFTTDPESLWRDLARAVELTEDVSAGEQMMIKAYQAWYQENDPDRAIEFYELLEKMYPKDKRTHFRLGVFYRLQGDIDAAIREQKHALAIDSDFAPSHLDLGYTNLFSENYAEAEEAFQNCIRLMPDQPNPYDSMGDLKTKMGSFEEAIEYYKMALEKDPGFADSQLKIGTNLIFLEKYDAAREAVGKAIAMETTAEGRIEDMGLICRSYLYEQRPSDALAAADEIIRAARIQNMMSQVALYEIAKGAIYVEMGEYDEAEQALMDCRTILETTTIPTFHQENYSDMLYFWEAAAAARQKEITRAFAIAARYMNTLRESRNPDRMKYHMGLLGFIELERDFAEISVEYFRQADIDEPLYMYYAALAEYQGGSRARAARLFRRLTSLNTDNLWYAFIWKKAMTRQE